MTMYNKSNAENLIASLEKETPKSKDKATRAIMEHLLLPHGKIPSEENFIENGCAHIDLLPESTNKVFYKSTYKYIDAANTRLVELVQSGPLKEKGHILKGLHELREEWTPYKKAVTENYPWTTRPQVYAKNNVYFIMSHVGSKSQDGKSGITKLTTQQKIRSEKAIDLDLHTGNIRKPSGIKLLDKFDNNFNLLSGPTISSMRNKYAKSSERGMPERGMVNITAKRTSEKSVISVIIKRKATSKKSKKAKTTELLKLTRTKEFQPRELTNTGLPLSRRTSSGITSITKKSKKSKATGNLTPKVGKTEKVFLGRSNAGLILTVVNKPPSVRASTQKSKENIGYVPLSPLKQLQKDKSTEIITPLSGKASPIGEKNVLYTLSTTSSALDLRLPQKLKPTRLKENIETLDKAQLSGHIIELEKKIAAHNISQYLAGTRLPLPTERVVPPTTEKVLVVKIKPRKVSKIPPKKIKRVAGLCTPLEGQTSALKEKMRNGQGEGGMPLSESKTSCDNSLAYTFSTKLGMPQDKTSREKAKGEELVLLKKTAAETGLPHLVRITSSKKIGKNKIRIKKLGPKSAKMVKAPEKRIGSEVKVKKTCERGCGCDKKKIKFKDSYIKIKVETPETSSSNSSNKDVNPVTYINHGGIRFTIGSAIGVPSYSREDFADYIPQKELLDDMPYKYRSISSSNTDHAILYNGFKNDTLCSNKEFNFSDDVTQVTSDMMFYSWNKSSSNGTHCVYTAAHTSSDKMHSDRTPYEDKEEDPCQYLKKYIFKLSSNLYHNEPLSNEALSSKTISRNNSGSVILTSASPTLSYSTSDGTRNTSSFLSTTDSGGSSNYSTHFFGCQLSNDLFSDPNTDESSYAMINGQKIKVR